MRNSENSKGWVYNIALNCFHPKKKFPLMTTQTKSKYMKKDGRVLTDDNTY